MKVNELKEEMSVDNAFSGMGTLFKAAAFGFFAATVAVISYGKH